MSALIGCVIVNIRPLTRMRQCSPSRSSAAERVGQARPHMDLVKLSHRGSNANVSTAMLDLIDCQRFLISPMVINSAHPNDAAIAKVIMSSDRPVTFFCNCNTARTQPWAARGLGVGATFSKPFLVYAERRACMAQVAILHRRKAWVDESGAWVEVRPSPRRS